MDRSGSEFELQQELERFTTRFSDRVTQATANLESSDRPAVRDEALRKNLLYVSSAMEIATGAFSEINLLDMIVFIRLSRAVLEHHWIPHLYGEEGRDLAEVFARSEQELADVAAQTLSPADRERLDGIVRAWLTENPDQVRVEGIRLADFASAAGSAAAERAGQAKGLLASVRAATSTANQALMLSERALFLFHRLPSVWRLQARLAAREVLADAVVQLFTGAAAPLVRVRQRVQELVRRGTVYLGLLGGAGMVPWRLGGLLRR